MGNLEVAVTMLSYAASFLYTVDSNENDIEKKEEEVYEDALEEEEFKTEEFELNKIWRHRATTEIKEISDDVSGHINELRSYIHEEEDLIVSEDDIFLLKVLRAKSQY